MYDEHRCEGPEPDVLVYIEDDIYVCVECSLLPMDNDFQTNDPTAMTNHMHEHLMEGESVATSMLKLVSERASIEGQIWHQ